MRCGRISSKQRLQDRLNQRKRESIEYRIEQRIEKIRNRVFPDWSGKAEKSPISMHVLWGRYGYADKNSIFISIPVIISVAFSSLCFTKTHIAHSDQMGFCIIRHRLLPIQKKHDLTFIVRGFTFFNSFSTIVSPC